jgi:hypothetical protein
MSETVSRGRDASRQADPRAAATAGVTPRRGRGRRVLAADAAAVVAAGVAVAATGPFTGAGHAGGGAASGYPTSLSVVARRLLDLRAISAFGHPRVAAARVERLARRGQAAFTPASSGTSSARACLMTVAPNQSAVAMSARKTVRSA